MPGRGDNNKQGSSGRGSSNQSNQGFGQAGDQRKTNHGDETGGRKSQPQPKKQDQSSNRNKSAK